MLPKDWKCANLVLTKEFWIYERDKGILWEKPPKNTLALFVRQVNKFRLIIIGHNCEYHWII